jgi:hypothetical protein
VIVSCRYVRRLWRRNSLLRPSKLTDDHLGGTGELLMVSMPRRSGTVQGLGAAVAPPRELSHDTPLITSDTERKGYSILVGVADTNDL